MRALSVQQPWATLIAEGIKTIETRGWYTRQLGPLLICSMKTLPQEKDLILEDCFRRWDLPVYLRHIRIADLPLGMALAKTTIQDCRLMTRLDEKAAMCECYKGAVAWVLGDTKKLPIPVRVTGKQGFFDVKIELPKVNTEGWLY